VALSSSHAYLATESGGLHVIDISDPANLRRIGGYVRAGLALSVSVALAGNYAYLATSGWGNSIGLEVIDLTDPAEPRRVGHHPTSAPAYDVRVSGHYAYVIGKWALDIFDVSDPASPRRVGGNSVAGGNSLTVLNDRLLVAGERGLTILNPFVPLRIRSPVWQPQTLRLSVSGPPDWPVRVQRSADLDTWQDWQTVTLGDQPAELSDREAGAHPRRFYRAIAP